VLRIFANMRNVETTHTEAAGKDLAKLLAIHTSYVILLYQKCHAFQSQSSAFVMCGKEPQWIFGCSLRNAATAESHRCFMSFSVFAEWSDMTEKFSHNLVSIIVPIYNCEKYLPTCLQSLADQTFSNIEVLLIDDGSTDASPGICADFVERDTRFHLYRKANGGVSSARNLGLDMAKGRYIGFVDADDWVVSSFVEAHLAIIRLTSCSISVCSYQTGSWETTSGESTDAPSKTLATGDGERNWVAFATSGTSPAELMDSKTLMKRILTDLKGFVWSKLFSAELLRDIRFDDEVFLAQDMVFCSKVLLQNVQCAYFADRLYCYRLRPGSATRRNIKEACSAEELPYRRAFDKMLALYAHDPLICEYLQNGWTVVLYDLAIAFLLTGDLKSQPAKRVFRELKARRTDFLRSGHANAKTKIKYVIAVYLPFLYILYRKIKPLPQG
jgi:glycosyltransferase involved in cell wall biosynthesis